MTDSGLSHKDAAAPSSASAGGVATAMATAGDLHQQRQTPHTHMLKQTKRTHHACCISVTWMRIQEELPKWLAVLAVVLAVCTHASFEHIRFSLSTESVSLFFLL